MMFSHTENSNKHNRLIDSKNISLYVVVPGKMDNCKWSYVDQCFTQILHSRPTEESDEKMVPLTKNGKILF